jgi:hypothetical protein
MASTYSNMKLQLMATGENSSTWGTVTNLNLGTAIEEMVVGSADVTFASATVTLTLTDTNATQTARNMRLNLTGTSGGAQNLIVPAVEKIYVVNNGCADAITVKNASGTGIAVPAGKTMWVYNNGTNVVDVTNHLTTLTLGTALPATSGGTGLSTYTTGDVIYASGTNTLSKLAAGANGAVLTLAAGVPAWTTTGAVTSFSAGTTGLTPSAGTGGAVTLAGTLAVANGGTGQTSYTDGQLLIGNSSGNTLSKATLTAGSNITITNSGGGITIAASSPGTGTVTSVNASGGTTGLSFSGGPITTSGTLTMAGTLIVANGGTGATTLTGVLKGNGTSAFSAATAGTDYVAPGTATSFTAQQTFSGSTSVAAAKFTNALEVTTRSATAATGTIAYDVSTQSIVRYTSNASANWTMNFRWSSGTSLNTAMATGETVTVVFMAKQGGTAYYNNVVQVDGTTSGVTTYWLNGAPTAGNANGVDSYTYSIMKTGSATFDVYVAPARYV